MRRIQTADSRCGAGRTAGRRGIRQAATAVVLVFAAAWGPGAVRATDSSSQERQIRQLQRQLQAAEAQLSQLAEQNRSLMERLQQIEQQLRPQAQSAIVAPGGPIPAAADTSALPAASSPSSPTTNFTGSPAAPGAALTGVPASAQSAQQAASPLPGAQPAGFGSAALTNLRLWGYGEIYYAHPTNEPRRAQADLARAVFGIGYRFDDRTEFNSEYEVEHAIASSGDSGEFEVEQFYIDRRLIGSVALRAGLFLMPFGLLNEHHEPTSFYGVQRNLVETLIIPSTWREGGLGFHGETNLGIDWNAGVTTGLDLSKWEFAPAFPLYSTALELEDNSVAPMQATHQELSLANGHDLSQYFALSYVGVPGLDVGGAITTGKAVPVPGSPGDPRLTLWEAHARWTPGRFDLSALYARGTLSDVAAANLANPGSPNPLPSQFYGYFFQAAFAVWEHGDYRLNPFVRHEYYDMGSRYSGTTPTIPDGLVPLSGKPGDLGPWPQSRDRVWTLGANFYVTRHVVFKADWQRFELNRFFDRFDLGLGLNF